MNIYTTPAHVDGHGAVTSPDPDYVIGACSYCGHYGPVIPASLRPGTSRYQCADGKACVARLDEISVAGRGAKNS